jgi:hypothetical protein
MRPKTKIIVGLVLVAAIASAVYVRFSPLAAFARRISDADHAVVTMTPNPPVSITITGQDLKRVVSMVSSAHRDTKQYDCSVLANVEFFKDNEMLGKMRMCPQLMWIGRGQYRDDTTLLESLVVKPLMEASWESRIQQQPTETK